MAARQPDPICQTHYLDWLDGALARTPSGGAMAIITAVFSPGERLMSASLGCHDAQQAVCAVASRIESLLRPDDHLLRAGENEFILALDNVLNLEHALLAASRIVDLFDRSVQIQNKDIHIRFSAGVALYPQHGQRASELVQKARLAELMNAGTDERFSCFNESFMARATQRHVIEQALKQSTEENDFALVYQPQIALNTERRMCGLECLLRWPSAPTEGGSPDVFIPVAEETGLIDQITRWVVNTSMRECSSLLASHPELALAINISPPSLRDGHLADVVEDASRIWGVALDRITLELTETAIMEEQFRCRDQLHDLRDLGVSVSIDDFGTGYSSLSYLTSLPINELKIDKSFIRDYASDARNERVIRSIVDLAHNLGLAVVAEGIETEAALGFLLSLNCDVGQGYFLGRPAGLEALEVLLEPSLV